ncbi:hypothetical protein CONPUDRAFT_61984 [Coniophora puteana RWD-64-598 SS2]|uniref:Uncharacterized protein n=1 Tax=Coniophora puteana (strain RWD-64-598) TaxID=741705 RepID=A0A5M3MGE5_CONPW|nr:uncharacterized protein CONPUDRAFT_61984 [Coniophora puteana RWD-64-598 SS2]EIW78066.1 hypothetical protein CONPUDRAFT_61984 [Coniophora puteana RWD-64-598 SS2]
MVQVIPSQATASHGRTSVKPTSTQRAIAKASKALKASSTKARSDSTKSNAIAPSASTSSARPTPAEIVDAAYKSDILPTLYDMFYASPSIWLDFTTGQHSVDQVQDLVDIVVPNSGYKVKHKDFIWERRSLIGKKAFNIVQKFYSSPEYANKKWAIEQHARWALHIHGPLMNREPTPRESIIVMSPKEPGYKHPTGHFESSFFVDLMSPLMQGVKGSHGSFGPPKGILSLAAIAVRTTIGSQFDACLIDIFVVRARIQSVHYW